MDRYLIIGLGNPGKEYDNTRHNIGFRIVKALAEKYSIQMRSALVRAKGSLGQGVIDEKECLLLLPFTYMNESGGAVKKCMDYYKIPSDHLIVIVDDVALPFGNLRLRKEGSAGGHNGLKSVEAYLGQNYPRLRVGIGDREHGELADYVLSTFTTEEERALPEIVDNAIGMVSAWLKN